MKRPFFLTLSTFLLTSPLLAQEVRLPHYLNFDGQLFDASNNPMSSATVIFEIYDGSATAYCLLYRETQTITPDASGDFTTKIGPDAGHTSSPDDGDISWPNIFKNLGQVRASSSFCPGGYTPAAGHGRKLRVTVNGTALTPDYIIAPAPMASVAETLQGKRASDFLESAPSSGPAVLTGDLRITQQVQLRNGANYVALQAPSLGMDLIFTLPANYGTGGQVLSTNGSGVLSWVSQSGGGGGITDINGETGSSQSLASGSSGTAPNWSHSAGVHTLNIPMASVTGVTAGMISKADYDAFNNKLGSGAGAVDDVHILAVDATKISTGYLSPSRLANGTITSAHLLDGTIATQDIADDAITNTKIDTVSIEKITSAASSFFTYRPNNVSCNNGRMLRWDNGSSRWVCSATLVEDGSIMLLPFGTNTGETGKIAFSELASGGSNFIALRAPDSVASNVVYTLPVDGSAGQVLQTNGSGILSWVNAAPPANSINFTQLADNMTLDASTNIDVTGTNVLSITNTGTGASFKVNDTASDPSPFVIDLDGRVGIGITTPTEALHIRSSPTARQLIESSSGASQVILASSTNSMTSLGALLFQNNYSGEIYPVAGIYGIKATAGMPSVGALMFSTTQDANTTPPSEKMRIDATGHVGIGTNAPASMLHINGVMRLSPQATQPAVCSAAGDKGQIAYANSSNRICFCDGTQWVEMNSPITPCTW